LLENCARRIAATSPILACDDPENWDWRAHVAQRRFLTG